jgi:hypothetical protein
MDSLQPLGDQAVLASFAEEAIALRFSAIVRRLSPPWMVGRDQWPAAPHLRELGPERGVQSGWSKAGLGR